MTALREAAQHALEALHSVEWHGGSSAWMLNDCKVEDAIHALRAALAEEALQRLTDMSQEIEAALEEPVQEPYCYVYEYDGVFGLHREFYPRTYNGMMPTRTVPVYTAPPQRKPLTEEEMLNIIDDVLEGGSLVDVARAVERAHGIKDA